VIAVGKARAEQHQERPAQRDHDGGERKRGPERPADRLGEEGRELLVLAGDMIFAEAVGAGRRHREIDKVDERQRLGGGVVDRDVGRPDEGLEHQRVHIGEHDEEAVDDEQRQRGLEPVQPLVTPRPLDHRLSEATVEQHHLRHHHHPEGGAGGRERGDRAHCAAGKPISAGNGDDGQGVRNIAGQQSEIDRVEGARGGILQRAHREDWQRQAHQQERHDVVGADAIAQREHDACHRRAGDDAEAEAQPAASRQEATQAVEVAAGAVFGNEALRRIGDAQRAQHAEEPDPGPGIDVDAEFEAPHPARQQHLAEIDDRRAGDADEEGAAGEALRRGMVAAVGAPRRDAVAQARQRSAR
jgi:hypothetical protein